ncbi:hypothetical protein G3H63_09140 [Microbacterium resistens]|uniref:hypothetical protein n=1 Tax=Microbacterium resistens TaxID=156977 RepID=UPI001C5826D3|nr:hypothetical protein [Microbacterium resistens]MBW1639235.1 hypothetical protein [Microbacterium resistens]
MAPAYENQTTGQVIVSDDPRPDLEALARWKQIPVPTDAPAPPAPPAADTGEKPDPVAPDAPRDGGSAVDGAQADGNADAVGAGESVPDAAVADSVGNQPAAGGDVASEAPAPPVPDESWTDEALDALAKERGIKFRSNTTKATKVAKLTAPAD